MATLVKLAASLTMDNSSFVNGLRNSTTELGRFKSRADNLTSGVIGVLGKVGRAAGIMALALGAAAIGVMAYSTNVAVSVESAYAGVIKTTDGLIDDTTGKLTELGESVKQEFRDMAMSSSKSLEELMYIGELGGQLGVGASGLAEFTNVVAGLTQATMLDAEAGAMALARVANIMGVAEEDYMRMGSVIVDLGNNFATTEPQIVEWAERIAGAGSISGMTTANLYSIGAAFSSVGIDAGEGGTSLQKVFIDMMNASNSLGTTVIDNSGAMGKAQGKLSELSYDLAIAQQRLSETTDKTSRATVMGYENRVRKIQAAIANEQESLGYLAESHGKSSQMAGEKLALFAKTAGVTSAEFSKLWKEDAANAFAMFVTGLGAAGEDATKILDQLEINDARQIRSMLAMAQNADLLTGAINAGNRAWDENNALTIEVARRNRTVKAQFTMVKNVIRDMALSIGDEVLPILADMIGMFRGWVEEHGPALVAWFNGPFKMAMANVRDLIGYVSSGLQLLFAGETENAMQLFKMGLYSIGRIFGLNVTEMQPFIDKLKEIGAGIATFVGWVKDNKDMLIGAFKGIALAIGGIMAFSAITSLIVALANPIVWIIALAALLGAAWGANWGGIQEKTQAVIDWLTPFITAALTWLKDFWAANGQAIIDGVVAFYTFLKDVFVAEFTFLWGLVQAGLALIKAFWDEHGVAIIAAVTAAWEWIKQAAIDTFNWLKTTVQSALASIKAFWDENGASIIAAVAGAWDWIKQAFFDALNWVAGHVASALNTIALWWQANGDTVIGVVTWLWDTIKLAFTTAFDILKGFVETFLLMLNGDWYEAGAKLRETVDTMWGAIKGLFTGAWIALGAIATWIWERIKANFDTGIEGAKTSVTDVIAAIKGFFTETDWGQLGTDIINGVRDGVVGAAVNLYNAVKNAVQGAIDFARGFAGMESPSKLTAEMIGKPFAQGIYEGIDRTMALLQRTKMPEIMGTLDVKAPDLGKKMPLDPLASHSKGDVVNSEKNTEFHLHINTSANSEPIIADFEMMMAMAGG